MFNEHAPHVVACDGSNQDYPFGFACTRCGERSAAPSPVSMKIFLDVARSFAEKHIGCKERESSRSS